MSTVEIVKRTFLFRSSTDSSEHILRLEIGDRVSLTGQTKNGFDQADFSAGDGTRYSGWVPNTATQEAEPEPRDELNLDGFIEICFLAAQSMNDHAAIAPWYVAPDFLIARALIETGLENAGPLLADSDAVGPLQMPSDEWSRFLAEGAPFNDGFNAGLRDHPIQQIWGAAWTMHRDVREMSRIRQQAGIGTREDPFIPSYHDVFHAHLTGSPKAALAILDASTGASEPAASISEVLKHAMTEEKIALFHRRRSQFAGTADAPAKLTDFIKATGSALDEAFKRAFALMQDDAPQKLPRMGSGDAPWYDVARTQLDIKEPDPHILDYFEATDHPRPSSTETPWCGAFVAYCLAESGDDTAKRSIPAGAAAAASWKGWGDAVPLTSGDIPTGAIVVLSPLPGTSSTGHVGFFEEFSDDGKVLLLGGNQSNAVCVKPFDRQRIVSIGWLNGAHVAIPSASVAPATDNRISDEAFDLIVGFEVSSQQVYEKKYRHPLWPGEASGVTIGIGYDVGYANSEQLTDDWQGVIPSPMISALKSALGATGRRAKPLARSLGDKVDIPWIAAITVHREKVMPRWVSLVEHVLPNTDRIAPDCLGALVSLVYNRGPSFTKDGSRYREMRAIKDCMMREDFSAIPNHIRAMRRLWPHVAGLQRRREREAALFERGLS